jgi:hypothetical protein
MLDCVPAIQPSNLTFMEGFAFEVGQRFHFGSQAVFLFWFVLDVLFFTQEEQPTEGRWWIRAWWATVILRLLDGLNSMVQMWLITWSWFYIISDGLVYTGEASDVGSGETGSGAPLCVRVWSGAVKFDTGVAINNGNSKLALTMLAFSSPTAMASLRCLTFKIPLWIFYKCTPSIGSEVGISTDLMNGRLFLRLAVGFTVLGNCFFFCQLITLGTIIVAFSLGLPLLGVFLSAIVGEGIVAAGIFVILVLFLGWIIAGDWQQLQLMENAQAVRDLLRRDLGGQFGGAYCSRGWSHYFLVLQQMLPAMCMVFVLVAPPIMRSCGNLLLLARVDGFPLAQDETYQSYFDWHWPQLLGYGLDPQTFFDDFSSHFDTVWSTQNSFALILSLLYVLISTPSFFSSRQGPAEGATENVPAGLPPQPLLRGIRVS